jgi:hypothetical protein
MQDALIEIGALLHERFHLACGRLEGFDVFVLAHTMTYTLRVSTCQRTEAVSND